MTRRELIEKVQELERNQGNALWRTHMLPAQLAEMLDATHDSSGQLTPDCTGMAYELGGDVTLSIYPFHPARIVLADKSNGMPPLEMPFEKDADFTEDMVLKLIGYHQLVKRGGDKGTHATWAKKLSRVGARE